MLLIFAIIMWIHGYRRAKILVNGVIEDAGGATNLPVRESSKHLAGLFIGC